MSKKEKVTEQNEQKVMTKYDQKIQKRKEQAEKAKKEKRRSKIINAAVIAVVVCILAIFPIRTYMVLNQEYINIGDEKVTQLEFDYNYNIVMNNYYNQYGTYMSYFGVDMTQDLSTQMYSDTLSWKDLFEQMAVENMIENRAILAEAEAAGFTYDTEAEFEAFKEDIKIAAEVAGVSTKDYVRQVYGSYATVNRIEDLVKDSIIVSAYYTKIAEEKAPTEDAVQAYYESNVDSYDAVDYRITTITAELPAEPTDDDITKAMEEARILADDAAATVTTDGELIEGVSGASVTTAIRDWLFDSTRKAGDVTVIEDDADYMYYVLAFEDRYLDETPSADVRVLISDEKSGEELLNEWKSGAATEESFGELCATYSADTSATNGGLYEGLTKGYTPTELVGWLFEEARTAGDTTAITSEDGTTNYVLYYVGQNDPEWKLSIESILTEEAMVAYLDEISEGVEVSDPKGKLNYLKVEEAAAEAE